MSLYRPAAFASDDQAAIARLFDEHPFATLITAGAGEPQISHLPLLHQREPAPHGSLIGHMARANPHWSHFGSGASLAIFHGPHAYVSPSWYAQPAIQVPTWNYAVVHVHGRAEIVADRAATLATLQQMIARFEGGRAAPWRLQLEGARLDAMVGAIVAFRSRSSASTPNSSCRRTGTKRTAGGSRRRCEAKPMPTRPPRQPGWIVRPAAIDPVATARSASTSGYGRRASTAREASPRWRSRPDTCASRINGSSLRALPRPGNGSCCARMAWSGTSW